MPIYEYRCLACRRRFSVFFLPPEHPDPPRCTRCGGTDVTRLMSRFSMVRSEESRLESLADPSGLGDLDESDPRSAARWMRRMGREMGDDLGSDFDEAVEELEATRAGDVGDSDAEAGGTTGAGGLG